MIIGLTGYAHSGKDTVAKILVEKYGFERRAFADAIRKVIYDMNPMTGGEPIQIRVDSDGWDKAKQHPEVRRLLQKLGVAARVHIGESVWINAALSNMKLDTNYVITDVRFINEAKSIQHLNGADTLNTYLWRVTRPEIGPVNNHVSESQLIDYPVDITIPNDGTIDDLELLVKTRMQGLL